MQVTILNYRFSVFQFQFSIVNYQLNKFMAFRKDNNTKRISSSNFRYKCIKREMIAIKKYDNEEWANCFFNDLMIKYVLGGKE